MAQCQLFKVFLFNKDMDRDEVKRRPGSGRGKGMDTDGVGPVCLEERGEANVQQWASFDS